jgi:hypothetical protein
MYLAKYQKGKKNEKAAAKRKQIPPHKGKI